MKLIKWLVIAILLLVAVPALYLTLFFSADDLKPLLVEKVKTQTGRELVISEPLAWQFFPSVGIKLGGVSLSNPDGFTEKTMASVKVAVAEVKLMPLLSRDIQIDELRLEGASLNLVTTKQGKSSFDGLTGNGKEAGQESGGAPALSGFSIGGIIIRDTAINLIDEGKGSKQSLVLESLTLDAFTPGKASELEFAFRAQSADMSLSGKGDTQLLVSSALDAVSLDGLSLDVTAKGEALPKGELALALAGSAKVALESKTAQLVLEKLNLAELGAKGELSVDYGRKVPFIDAKLALGATDVAALLGESEPADANAKAKANANAGSEGAASAKEPDLSALKAVDAKLDLSIESVKVAGLTTTDWQVAADLNGGVLKVSKLAASLYGGKLDASASLDGRQRPVHYSFNKQLLGVQIRPLLMALAEVDMLEGLATFSVQGKGVGLLPERLKKELSGNGRFEITDGALHGVNVAQMIRSAQAKLKGDMSSAAPQEQKTDFSALTGTLVIGGGKVHNPDLLMLSPLLRISGRGDAYLLDETLDYRLATKVVGSLEGQGGSSALSGVEIPLIINGGFTEPKFALDTEALMKGQLKQETDKLKDKLKDSLFNKLGGN
ncbi:AsmA family protein [Shewanella sp. JM162201]|uniref:AsmA family protein n=1 Tax=Shewanella jiangmenensis TaxID=2837387 RepID=A0ABS5V4Z3_9GAMM|nr:AsmA family protein [Shewanella jiangmenensis]MBT1445536.1 AsmA family protein [Shewanella jiangmenensis]